MTKPYIQVVSPPTLKLHEWQAINRAEKVAQDLLKPKSYVIQVCKSYWTDGVGPVETRIRVRVHKGQDPKVLRKDIPQKVMGVPVVVLEE